MVDLKLFEDLPYRERMNQKYGWDRRRKSDHHPIKGISYWKYINRTLYNNIGKSFDMAFHYYCTKAPKYQQHLLLEEFYCNYTRYFKHFYLDENKCIQITPGRKKLYIAYSDDFKVCWKHKVKGFTTFVEPYYFDIHNYERSYVGEKREYTSRRDPEFIAYKRKKVKAHKKAWGKEYKKERERKSIEIFNRSIAAQKEKVQKEKELDLIKRNAAGFDEASFVGGSYHGRKKKIKNNH